MELLCHGATVPSSGVHMKGHLFCLSLVVQSWVFDPGAQVHPSNFRYDLDVTESRG